MKRTFLVAALAILALLIGRYGIPSGGGKGPSASVAPSSVPQASPAPTSASPEQRRGVRISETPETVVYDEDPESEPEYNRRAAPQVAQAAPAAGTNQNNAGIFVNGRELSQQQVMALVALYRTRPIPGRYWYDRLSGAWGIEGHETVGFLMPGHDFGPMSPNASAGNTGVFINGRELNMAEAMSIQRNFGAVYRGRWWLDGRTGNYGMEGNPMPVGNLLAVLRAQGGGGTETHVSHDGMGVNTSSTGCSSVFTSGAGGSSVAAYPGC